MPGILLLTAFEPLDGRSANTSLRVLGRLRASPPAGVAVEVLPAEGAALRRSVPALLGRVRPQRWLILAEDAEAHHVRCERFARNVFDAAGSEAEGTGASISRDGPEAYFSTLDPAWLRGFLREQGLPAELSDSPGVQAGNLAFYLALHHARRAPRDTEIGFLHVPQRFRRTGRTLDEIRAVLEHLADALQGDQTREPGRLGLRL